MNTLKLTLAACLLFLTCLGAAAQIPDYEQKIEIGNGLYKVMTNGRWGVIDADGNLKLSAEHNEPIFADGKAVISKYGSNQLVGIMDMAGNITPTPQYFINPDFPLVSDDMLVVRESPDGLWGYLNTSNGFPIFVRAKGFKPGKDKALKALGINGKNLEGNFVFDFAAPFIDGIAAVYAERLGWLHIDKKGNVRFINPDGYPTLFRSSVNNGKSIIFDNRGIVLSMETPDQQAGVAMFYDSYGHPVGYTMHLTSPFSFTNNGATLYLNDKFQADKLVKADGDSIIFIERVKPVIIEIDSVAEAPEANASVSDIDVALVRKNVSANSKGVATVTFKITNNGSTEAKNLSVTVEVQGKTKQYTGDLGPGATTQISINVPARFSSPSVTKKASWTIAIDGTDTKSGENVTIARYKPNRR